MKIGILTFHRALNYGAVLQAYALREFLKDMGFEAEIIDYRNDSFEDVYHSFKINLRHLLQFKNQSLKSMLRRCMEICYLQILSKKFATLLCNKRSQPVTAVEWTDAIRKYDRIVTGSDQVWNKELTNNDMIYYLKDVPERKRASFAASIGGFDIMNDEESLNELEKFSYISFREKESMEKLKDKIKKECSVHLDPVFLLTEDRWKGVMKYPDVKEKYVLIFSMNKLPKLVDYAEDYAEKHGKLSVYYLSPVLRRARGRKVKQIWFASPTEFLGWIYNAEYIFTDSFHGCAFSIVFDKPFYADVDRTIGSSNRIINLLQYFGLERNAEISRIGSVASAEVREKRLGDNLESAQQYFNRMI